jgi:hypothetical protein
MHESAQVSALPGRQEACARASWWACRRAFGQGDPVATVFIGCSCPGDAKDNYARSLEKVGVLQVIHHHQPLVFMGLQRGDEAPEAPMGSPRTMGGGTHHPQHPPGRNAWTP